MIGHITSCFLASKRKVGLFKSVQKFQDYEFLISSVLHPPLGTKMSFGDIFREEHNNTTLAYFVLNMLLGRRKAIFPFLNTIIVFFAAVSERSQLSLRSSTNSLTTCNINTLTKFQDKISWDLTEL